MDERGFLVFEDQTYLEAPLEETFAFFSAAENLGKVTPDWVHFQILSNLPIEMAMGTLIDYQIRLHGIPIKWRTRITEWNPPHHFTDEQLRGPYRTWIHRHSFTAKGEGTLMTDRIHYRVWGGILIDRLLVRRDIEKIFKYRKKAITKLIGKQGID